MEQRYGAPPNVDELLGLIDELDAEGLLDNMEDDEDFAWVSDLPQLAFTPAQKKRRLALAISWVMNILVFLICIVMIVGAVGFAVSKDPKRSFFGYRIYNVISESMTPTKQENGEIPKGGFFKGDAIVVKKASPEEVKVNDIISFNILGQINGQTVTTNTHRVIEILSNWDGNNEIYFVTRGDHNNVNDPMPVRGSDLIGIKQFRLPGVGKVLSYAQTHLLLSVVICVVVFLLVFLLFALITWSCGRIGKKEEARANQLPEPEPPPPVPAFPAQAPLVPMAPGDYAGLPQAPPAPEYPYGWQPPPQPPLAYGSYETAYPLQ